MKTWITIPVDALSNLDYSKLAVTNADNAPKNIAGDTAMIKWRGDMPSEVANIENKGAELDHSSALELLRSAEWKKEYPV